MIVRSSLMVTRFERTALVLVVTWLGLVAGTAASTGGTLFDGGAPLPMVLEGPWGSILRDREDKPEVAGRLILGEAADTGTGLDVRIKVRGKWRLENCDRPPLTLKLEGKQLDSTPFAGQAVVHLTPQCRWGKKFEQHLVQEYLIFSAYSHLTDVSLRARLAAVELRDPGSRRKPWAGYMILVEDLGLAAGRLGLEWSEVESVGPGKLDPDAAALFTLFQYMIGHTDWSIVDGPERERCCHNAALFASPGSRSGLLPVPYDFDASGLVDSGEIEPSARLPIRSVRQRLYRGFCIHNAKVPGAVEELIRLRPEFESLIADADLLSANNRRRAERFLDDFYEIVEDPGKLESKVLARCRE